MTDRIADEIGDDLLDPLRIDDDHGVWDYIYFSRYRMPGCCDVEFSLLDQLLHEQTGLPIHIAEDPLSAVAEGTGKALQELDFFTNVTDAED